MLCLLSGLCEKLNQEAKKPTNGLLCARWHPNSVRIVMFFFRLLQKPHSFQRQIIPTWSVFVWFRKSTMCKVIFVSVSLNDWVKITLFVSPFRVCFQWVLQHFWGFVGLVLAFNILSIGVGENMITLRNESVAKLSRQVNWKSSADANTSSLL